MLLLLLFMLPSDWMTIWVTILASSSMLLMPGGLRLVLPKKGPQDAWW
jgi:hypothetical protein